MRPLVQSNRFGLDDEAKRSETTVDEDDEEEAQYYADREEFFDKEKLAGRKPCLDAWVEYREYKQLDRKVQSQHANQPR